MSVSPRSTRLWKRTSALALLFFASAIIKSSVWQLPPQVFNDSAGYLVPAISLLAGKGYGIQEDGFRSPTYPLFLFLTLAPVDRTDLAVCRDAHDAVCIGRATSHEGGRLALRLIVLSQILLGLVVTAILFSLGARLTGSTWMALLFGAGYALNPATAYWEISILTETLTTLLVSLAFYLTLRAGSDKPRSGLALGLVLAALALCHQLYIIFWVLPGVFLLWRARRSSWSRRMQHVAPVVLVPLTAVVSWSAFNYIVNGSFTPSTLSGYVLIQMVAPVVQNAPAGYGDITEIYVGYRDAMIAQTGTHSGAIFRAWPDLLKESGLTWTQVSGKLTGLSLYLIVAYPASYLRVAGEGLLRFWDFPFYHYDPVPGGPIQWMLWFTNQSLQTFLNWLFWISPFAAAGLWLRGSRSTDAAISYRAILLAVLAVWISAVIAGLTNFQDNARMHTYTLPLEYATIALVLWVGWRTARRPPP